MIGAASQAALPAEGEPWSQMGILTIRVHKISWHRPLLHILEITSTSFRNWSTYHLCELAGLYLICLKFHVILCLLLTNTFLHFITYQHLLVWNVQGLPLPERFQSGATACEKCNISLYIFDFPDVYSNINSLRIEFLEFASVSPVPSRPSPSSKPKIWGEKGVGEGRYHWPNRWILLR